MTLETTRLRPEEWQRYRAIRLLALEEAPDAFGSTLERELAFTETDWRHRLREGCLVAVAVNDGRDVAVAVGAPYEGRAGLFGVWVAPEARGLGAGRSVCTAVVDWAREGGYAEVVLDVGDHNGPAMRLYESMGFERTGRTGSLPAPREHVTEHERLLRL